MRYDYILCQLHSMRILPHHQDTGGFFVAVLEKVKSLPWESEACNISQNVQNVTDDGNKDKLSLEEEAARDAKLLESGKRPLEEEMKPQRKRRRIVGYREDPFVFFKDESEDAWQSIK